ncbi:UPF0182 family protein [Aeromicrobium terrae]|uniref:UPF0182 protein FHP06_08450 n=2 Tax=Aeromicrobium terrae TaxID=2498846 RepID=A0A5C8NJX8_9ACTN|nr:UPF0182 family protein [Aeromicrobium terrae]
MFLGSIFTSVWTDRLWFKSVDYSGVFTTVLVTRTVLFVVMGVLFGAFVVGNVYLAWRLRPSGLPARNDDPAARYRQTLGPIIRPVLIVLGVVLTAFAGSVAASHWDTYQMWAHGTSFGQKDPQFHKDIGFYVFDYPWLRFLTSFSFAMIVIAVLATVFMHYVFGGIRFAGRGPSFTRAAQVHLSILIGIGVLLRALSYWLDRFGLAVGSSSLFDGIGYTDAHARIPARNILIGIAIVCALLLFAAAVIRSWVLPAISLGLLLLTSILIGGIWPFVMQSFQVKPSEPDKEGPYIARNIEATRDAYGVADTKVEQYTAKTSLTPSELTKSAESRVSTRLLDPTLIAPAFEQLQQVRGYYTVQDTLDVDRYKLDGTNQPQDIIIAAREINLDGLQDSQRNWANDHTVYTHGYGVIAARGNKRGSQGEPVWVEKDIPPVGDLKLTTPPRIYFGEKTPSYSIVGQPKGKAPVEVDIPRGGESGDDPKANATQNTYDGKGGVPIGNVFNKLLYTFKFAEPNIFLSSRVNSSSKILYDRQPRDRVKKVAPWLTVDGDTYPAVVDGRVVWIVDAYTTSNSYPYSQHSSLREATDDTLTQGQSQAALPTDQVNYMRNSVKAVVDAYDGTVKLYQWDTKDPVLKTWMKVFPDVVTPKSEIKQSLMEHLRYPVDLFKVQRYILREYHVTDAQTFYEGGERWKVPEDPAGSSSSLQPPYYLTVARPGETDPKFSLTTVYLPNSRQNLASFVSVNSEATSSDYGTMQILQLPSDTQLDGPSQIANRFSSDKGVTQALLQFRQSDAQVLNGNLLTLPVGDGLLYVQPVYIRRSAAEGTYPVLQFVAATFGEDVGFGQTLDEALRVALGLEPGSAPTDDSGAAPPPSSGDDTGDSKAKTTSQYLADASKAYNDAQDALKKGDLATYQSKINQMNDLIEKAQDALKK